MRNNLLLRRQDLMMDAHYFVNRRKDYIDSIWDRTNKSIYLKYEGDCLLDQSNELYSQLLIHERVYYPILIRGNDEV